MKVLHINTGDFGGGAARAAYRIHHSLVKSGIDSSMRVLQRVTGDERVSAGARPSISSRLIRKFRYRWQSYQQRDWSTDNPIQHTFGHIGAGLVNELNTCDADILHLHWVSDMLSIADIGRLRKPIVWTLHDMWPFCGGEHYAPDDETARFRRGYNADNRPQYEGGPDLNRQTWLLKHQAWRQHSFTIVSPSCWLAKCAQQSILFGKSTVHVIPNPIEMEHLWRPIPRDSARVALGLPQDKKLVLMGAFMGTADPRKGSDLLREALKKVVMRLPDDVELMIYGQEYPVVDEPWSCAVHWLGVVRDDRVLALAYSAADVMVVPSRQDNLPNTAVEAQACGTPVVAFDIGGLPDIVTHCETGWLAKPFDTADLANGIVWLLEDATRLTTVSTASRQQAMERFSESVVAAQYAQLYHDVL